ncbi:MAG: hypothetical protein QOF25_3509 [Mycobacterium sp.]|nr:hypothetical protein [Mycobacterium sp.]
MVQVRGGLRPGAGCLYEVSLTYVGGVAVTKRLIEIDDELREAARRELGTTAREFDWLVSGGMAEMADRGARDDVRR